MKIANANIYRKIKFNKLFKKCTYNREQTGLKDIMNTNETVFVLSNWGGAEVQALRGHTST